MKILFIGLGSIATKHIKDLVVILEKKRVEFEIYVLRREIGDISSELGNLSIKQITEVGDLYFDVAFITNPTNLHYSFLEQLNGKTKFYFIEKPIFENCQYDLSKLDITEKNAYIACPLRHSNVYKKLKEIVKKENVYNARLICSSYLPDWRPNIDYRKIYSSKKDLGGGVTLDLIHEIDYMIDLFGFPEKVYNVHGKYSHLEIDSDDLSIYIAVYKDKLCEVHLDYFGRKYQRKCEIYTKSDTYFVDFKSETIETSDGDIIDCRNEGKSNLYLEMEYFFDFISSKVLDNYNSPKRAFEVLKITLGE